MQPESNRETSHTVHPPIGSIRTEIHAAVVDGIRQRGPAAAGMVVMALARLLVVTVTLTFLAVGSTVLGYEPSPLPYTAMTAASALVSWLTVKSER